MCISSNEYNYTKRNLKIDLSKIKVQINNSCKECENWKHKRLWIGYKFCPYCGRTLNN